MAPDLTGICARPSAQGLQGNRDKPRKTPPSSARPAHVAQTRVPPTWRWISPEPPQFRTARRMPERETDQTGDKDGETRARAMELRPPLGTPPGRSSGEQLTGAARPAVIVALASLPSQITAALCHLARAAVYLLRGGLSAPRPPLLGGLKRRCHPYTPASSSVGRRPRATPASAFEPI